MERRSSYFVLTIFMPVIMLLLLNSVVFLLPTDSGERVGYSITCLLALAVFLTLTADNLPRTSDPLSVLACFLMLLVMTSAGICLMTILSVWLHHKDEKSPMPIYLKKFVYHVLCRGRKTQKADDKRVIVTVETPKSTSKVKRDFKGTQSHGTKKVQMNGIRPTSLRQIKVHSVDEIQPKENKNTDDPYSDITWKMFAELFNLLCLVVTLSFTGILFFLYVLIARGNLWEEMIHLFLSLQSTEKIFFTWNLISAGTRSYGNRSCQVRKIFYLSVFRERSGGHRISLSRPQHNYMATAR